MARRPNAPAAPSRTTLTADGIRGLQLLDAQAPELVDGGAYFALAQKALCVADLALNVMRDGLQGKGPQNERGELLVSARDAAFCFQTTATQIRSFAEDLARMIEASRAGGAVDAASMRTQLESMRELYVSMAPELGLSIPPAMIPPRELREIKAPLPLGRRKTTHGDPRDGLTKPPGGWKAYRGEPGESAP